MYHYVRPIKNSTYPDIKGLELNLFFHQLDYLKKYYTYITIDELIDDHKLPKNAVLLTFDDGFMDHYKYVFPELLKRKIKGAFFPPTKCILDKRMLDTHKIHFILASVKNKNILMQAVDSFILDHQKQHHLKSVEEYKSIHMQGNEWDPPEVIYIKRMLQHALPAQLRETLIKKLFSTHVSSDEKSFANEIYMDKSHLIEMIDANMHIGGHGAHHLWLEHLPTKQQEQEIDDSLKLLNQIYKNKFDFTFCYPFGSYNEDTLKILHNRNCRLGFTTHFDVCDLNTEENLQLSRLDTTHLPTNRNSPPNHLTTKVLEHEHNPD